MPGLRKYNLTDYRIRVLGCLAASLLLVLLLVKLWPLQSGQEDLRLFGAHEQEVIEFEEIRPTRQSDRSPPPPAPPIPVIVPNDLILDEVELELSESALPTDRPEIGVIPNAGGEAGPARSAGPTIGPKTVRFVEPEYTREARRKRVRAELVVKVLVDEKGQVRQTEVVERFLLDKDGAGKTPVDLLGYGLEEAAVSAAERWIFRPARKDGEAISSYTTLTFTFGV